MILTLQSNQGEVPSNVQPKELSGSVEESKVAFYGKVTEIQLKSQFLPATQFLTKFHASHSVFRLVDSIQVVTTPSLIAEPIFWALCDRFQTNLQFLIPKPADSNKVQVQNKMVNCYCPVQVLISHPTEPLAPSIEVESNPEGFQVKTLFIDLLIFSPNSEKTEITKQRIETDFYTQLGNLVYQLNSKVEEVKSYYFEVPTMEMVINGLYPVLNENELLPVRTAYHQLYDLPNQPLLRNRNTLNFTPLKVNTQRLQNVHLGLTSPGDGMEALVKGTYCYYHYTQDNFHDEGWGCAYRSLQTIESWFIHQGYTTKQVQSHRDIQKALFSLGQRNRKFIGSSEWIGSIEIQSAIREHMEIESKILHISKGSEIANHTETLMNHFQKQGTPIMIGGGQLAYTMLGVHYNQTENKTIYLILDPHYTGKDLLSAIQKKGWCGWKEAEIIFKDTYFFNLCLPQVPVYSNGI